MQPEATLQPHLLTTAFRLGLDHTEDSASHTHVLFGAERPKYRPCKAFCYLITRDHFSGLWISFETDGLAAYPIKRDEVMTLSRKISLLSAAVVSKEATAAMEKA